MCGITGLWSPPHRPHSPELTTALLPPRAPLARPHPHLRPPSPLHHRPLFCRGPTDGLCLGRFTIVFDGEVYNFGALRDQLQREANAPAWRAGCDTEVMLAATATRDLRASEQRSRHLEARWARIWVCATLRPRRRPRTGRSFRGSSRGSRPQRRSSWTSCAPKAHVPGGRLRSPGNCSRSHGPSSREAPIERAGATTRSP
jgi:hypothetical protein